MGVLSGYRASGSLSAGSTSLSEPTVEERALAAGYNPDAPPQKSLKGFLGNIIGDVREIGGGLTSLVSAAGSDLFDAGKELATGGRAETDGYNLAEMGRRLPDALKQDYSRRYGLEGADVVKDELYENPLAYLGDALTVLSAGGYGAARAAQLASKVPSVSKGLNSLGEAAALQKAGMPGMAALTCADDVSAVVRTVDKILPGLKTPGSPVAGTRSVVNPRTGRVQTKNAAFNPARRVWNDAVTKTVLAEPRMKLERSIADLEMRIQMQGGPELAERALVNDLALKQNALRLADEADNAPILREYVADKKVAQITNRLLGKHGSGHVRTRDAMTAEFANVLKRLDDSEADEFLAKTQVDLPTWELSRMDFDEVRATVAAPSTNKDMELAEAIQDDLARIDMMESGQAPDTLVRQARGDLKDELKQMHPELGHKDLNALTDSMLDARLAELLPYEIEMAKRYVEWLSEGAVADKMGYVENVGSVMDDLRLTVHKNLTSEYLNSGGTYRSVFERALKPMNKVVSESWDFDAPDAALALDELLMSQGHKAPVYVPHIETLNLKVSDFVMPWRLSGMRKAAEGGRKGFKRSEGEVFDRWLEGVKDAAITNPLDAYARRAAEIARHKESIYFLRNLAEEVGRPIEALDDLAPHETVLNLDGAKVLIRKRMEVADGLAEDMMDVGDLSGAVQSAAQEALLRLPDEVAQVFGQKGALYAVPKTVADQVDKLMQYRMGYKARLFFDGPLNAWRNLALYFRPAFYVNNIMGNSTFIKLQGGSLGSVFRQVVDPKYRHMVREFIGENLDEVETTGFFDHPGQRATHFGRHQDKLGAQVVTAVKESAVGKKTGWFRDKLQNFNQTIEDAFRREAYLTAAQKDLALSNVKGVGRPLLKSYKNLENMMEHSVSPERMANWLEETNKVMNDYSALSPFERNVIRRAFIPFWPFYKHAAKTLFRMPFDHPIKAQTLNQFGMLLGEMSEEQLGGEVEPWLKGMFPVGEMQPGGEQRIFAPQSMNPLSDIVSDGNMVKNAAEQLNPYWKVGAEQAFAENLFTGKDFTDPNVLSAFGRDRQFAIDPETGAVTEAEPPRPNIFQHLLGQVPMVDMAQDFLAGGAAYSAHPTQAIPDPENPGQALYPNDYGLMGLRFLGVPSYDSNPQEYRQKLEEDRMAAMATWLSRQGY